MTAPASTHTGLDIKVYILVSIGNLEVFAQASIHGFSYGVCWKPRRQYHAAWTHTGLDIKVCLACWRPIVDNSSIYSHSEGLTLRFALPAGDL